VLRSFGRVVKSGLHTVFMRRESMLNNARWIIAGLTVCTLGCLCLIPPIPAQEQPDEAKQGRGKAAPLRFDYVGYRAARWEQEKVMEPQNERPNRGGLANVYFTNVSEKPVSLRFWRLNGEDASYYRLGGFIAWDRLLKGTIAPGEMTVLEIDGISEDFAPGKPFRFGYVGHDWRSKGTVRSVLKEDTAEISYIRVLPGMKEVEIHVRHTGEETIGLESVEIVGVETKNERWRTRKLAGPSHAIARLETESPITPSQLLIVKLTVKSGDRTREVYAHRRAFEDWFPIGTWSSEPDKLTILRHHHIETIIKGGRADDPFYSKDAERYGLRTIVPVGVTPDVDTIRSLGAHPVVACWMLTDEPDWSDTPTAILMSDTITRQYNSTKPTFVTLCRNVKFFEYASIVDIPCMDHYSVTAPSSSRWPKPYGTRLEETAYYTRDLKAASEPKPIWIWSQGIASWEERPKRPVPTPDEFAAQLILNLGRGAKGILWFNFELDMGEKYPDTRDAIRNWGRVLRVMRDDLIGSEPVDAKVQAPSKVDVAPLVAWDKLILAVTNLDYEISDTAYPWRAAKNVNMSVDLPEWIHPEMALVVAPEGIKPLPVRVSSGRVEVPIGDLKVCQLVVLCNDANDLRRYEERYQQALADEQRGAVDGRQ